MDTQRPGNANSIGHLHHAPPAELIGNQVLGDPPGSIGSRPIDLGWVLAREGTSTMSSPASISIRNDLPSCEAGVSRGPANHELLAWVENILGSVEPLGIDDMLDYVLGEVGSDSLVGDVGVVLGRDKHRVHADGLDPLLGGFVLDRHLHLPIGAEPVNDLFVAALLQSVDQLVGERMGERHQLLTLIGGITDHKALITSTNLLGGLIDVH
jgi:hypothetical protein